MAETLLPKMAANGPEQAGGLHSSNKQQAGGLHSISRVRQSPEAPNLGRSFPYLRRSYPPSLGPQLAGGAGWRRHYCQKWPQMGPNKQVGFIQATATSRRASFEISGTPIARGPKLRPKGPLPKALLPTKFGPPTPGWHRSAARLLLKMAKNGPVEAEMGPKGAKTAQNGPKCPQSDPKPRKKVPLRKATLSPCVWTPNSRVAPVGDRTIAKNGQKCPPGGQNGPKMGQSSGQF